MASAGPLLPIEASVHRAISRCRQTGNHHARSRSRPGSVLPTTRRPAQRLPGGFCAIWAVTLRCGKKSPVWFASTAGPPYLLEKPDPEREVISLSWLVNNRLLYLFAIAD